MEAIFEKEKWGIGMWWVVERVGGKSSEGVLELPEARSIWPLAFRRKAQTEGERDVTASCCRCIEDSESVDDAQTDAQDDILLTLLSM